MINVRETVGWKFASAPPPKANGKETPATGRRVGLLVREYFIDTKLHQV